MIVLATISGAATTLLSGGRTTHSRFEIPLQTTNATVTRMSKQNGGAKLIRKAKLIIWDEAPMASRRTIETVDRSFRDILDINELFGGKVMVFGGNFRQVLSVIPKSTRAETKYHDYACLHMFLRHLADQLKPSQLACRHYIQDIYIGSNSLMLKLFYQGDPLNIKVNKLSSTKTQLPYDFYYLKYCKPTEILNTAENLGEVLRGDRIENSVYTFQMRQEQPCQVVCRQKLNAKSAKNFKEKIDDEYRVNMILDNLPVAVLRQRRDGSQSTTYEHGFRVGFKGNYAGSKEGKYFINNHLSFRVMYHRDAKTDTARIVGFEVTPNSINHEYKEWNEKNPQVTTCNPNTKHLILGGVIPQEVDTDKEVIFSYDVSFKESDIRWASRWDTYLLMNDDQIHWFSIVNSLMIVLFLSGMVAMIMMRTLYRDIANYNQLETKDEAQEETGWKLVHGDVFRPPINCGLLCVYVGTGVQIFAMTLVTMIFAVLGFLSPSNRGGLMTAMVLLWVFMGLFAGYSSVRLYKTLRGTEWKRITLRTALMFPGILFAVFFVLNALIWGEKSSGAVPFGTMFALVCLWFGISVPLVFVGGYMGSKKMVIEEPVKTNKIPRQIPELPWYMKPAFSILIGGILPFGAVFIELFFILTSIWLNQFYYIFGFLFIVFLILVITCAEITMVLCYFQLCSEDYYWWWRAYLTAGSSSLYFFLYSVFYFFSKLEITKLVSGILYFGYMLIASYAFFVLTGTIGFYSCFWFVRRIYSSVKID
ncbi:Transmembrane 9 superfamily member 9 [Capsicum annuum]|nr:Transmembrane 9 superfamily member 9 [Capsicum annuum]